MGLALTWLARLRGRLVHRLKARRVVVILDKDGGNLSGALKGAAAIGAWFVVLSVGYPQTTAQDEAVERTFNAAGEVSIPIEAVLVASRRSARKAVRWGDALMPGSPRTVAHV